MAKKRFFDGMLVMALVFGFVLAACGGGTSALVGRWASDEDSTEVVEFLKDGTGIVQGSEVAWKAENGRLFLSITALGQTQTVGCGYKISGATLTLTDDDGEVSTYTKKK
jgi:hypothetical protein